MCLTIQGNSPALAKDPPNILVLSPPFQRAVTFEYSLQAVFLIKYKKLEIIFRNSEI